MIPESFESMCKSSQVNNHGNQSNHETKPEYPRGADRLKSVPGGKTQMWGGSTQHYVARIDFGADRPVHEHYSHQVERHKETFQCCKFWLRRT